MIPQGVQVFVALEPVYLRYSFDRLSGFAKEHIGYDARSGTGVATAHHNAARRKHIDRINLIVMLCLGCCCACGNGNLSGCGTVKVWACCRRRASVERKGAR